MGENKYKCSDTKLTASWEKKIPDWYSTYSHYFSCTNCGCAKYYDEDSNWAYLTEFCPRCGFRMTNAGDVRY